MIEGVRPRRAAAKALLRSKTAGLLTGSLQMHNFSTSSLLSNDLSNSSEMIVNMPAS